jgi:hypothetical protein
MKKEENGWEQKRKQLRMQNINKKRWNETKN